MANGSDAGLRAWLGGRIGVWQQIEARQQQLARGRRHDVSAANALVDGYRTLARDLSIARQLLPGSRVTRFLEGQYQRAHALLARPAHGFLADLKTLLVDDVPATTRELSTFIFAIAALFVFSGLAGAWLVSSFPELATLFASEEMIWTVESGDLWTDSLVNVVPSAVLSAGILANNIAVSVFAYCVGVIFGLGTFYIIATNGLMIGGMFAFTHQHDLAFRLFEFVIAHGPVELTTIVFAGAAGAAVGEALIRPTGGSRAESFRRAVSRTSRYLVFCALLLIGAGLIEGFISASPTFPLLSRAVIGGASWLIAIAAATGLLYRRRPQPGAPPQTRRRARIRS
ncbi:MAG: stage II sporulation protein M [Steroidobacteraceae bacterium]